MNRNATSDTVTEGIRVHAVAQYLPDESDPESKRFCFAYRIRISNEGERRARLLMRHWVILDADNDRRDVRGPGVVGAHPDLAAGESHEYTSSCVLPTHWGTMEGSYTFERQDGARFEVAIGRFFLVPQSKHSFELTRS